MRLRRGLVYQRDTNEMVVLKIVLRDYPVANCPAISQNIYMYTRAGKDIETAGQLGSCPQKVLGLTTNHRSMKTQQLTSLETLCSRIYDTRHAGSVVFTNLPA